MRPADRQQFSEMVVAICFAAFFLFVAARLFLAAVGLWPAGGAK